MAKAYQIGELARHVDVPVATIRYYEREALLPKPERSAGNFRLYSETHRERLVFIRQCRALDMTLEEISSLLALKDHPQKSCEQVNTLIDDHLADVTRRVAELQRLQKDLETLRLRCGSIKSVSECAILAGLSQPSASKRADIRKTQQS
ncbi:Cd(II)/Pb(II)-responsive transcriptional regulator [Steroidobacter flavus]|uniref:Cd(II)/Pb(II)-responsive transcriptional regulator n=1 Tax=Steroidobacter flavus TaxID=1842136 RepID=A0ABV8SNW6_9GAMM